MREMVLGSEGRLGVLTEAKVRVTPLPDKESFHLLFFPGWRRAQEAVRDAVQDRIPLSMLRLSNPVETQTQLALAGHERIVKLMERLLACRGVGEDKCMLVFGLTGGSALCNEALRQSLRVFRGAGHIRPLRGSHLVFPFWRLPVSQALTLLHPTDGRYVFLLPWEGATVVGNTDLDHDEDLSREARITHHEVDYLLDAVQWLFPSLGIKRGDIVSTYSGIRPVIVTGILNPSAEKRNHSIWVEQGLISVSGGKLTTFRLIALDVLRHAARVIPSLAVKDMGPLFREAEGGAGTAKAISSWAFRRLAGRYGRDAQAVIDCAEKGELVNVPGTDTLWAELRWAARRASVVHLEDLLLRRTRLGLLLPKGGAPYMDRVKGICREELGWDAGLWQQEEDSYKGLWLECYGVPEKDM